MITTTEEEFQKWQDKFYKSKVWMKLRDYIKTKYFGICQVCNTPADINSPTLIVHHKNPITKDNCEDPGITLNEDNLTLLCQTCHNQIHMNKGERVARFDEYGNVLGVLDLNVGESEWDYLP